MPRHPRVEYRHVVEFAQKHEGMFQSEIGRHFNLSQKQISRILRDAGIIRRKHGRPPAQHGQTNEQFYWEKKLYDLKLGMDRGLRVNNQRILYGQLDDSSFEVNAE